ncbi:MAG: SMC-Scp complex subunit ScpB [Spirochaetota bacterium]|nr:SMC-Scp complex subunit ScpB [Spirochaetota bacterium]
MEVDKYSAIIEAVLLHENEVVPMERLVKYTGLEEDKIREIINELSITYEQNSQHGITVVEIAGGYALQVKKSILPEFKEIYSIKEKSRLSKSAMMVLTIIAYKQPITKNEIEVTYGVSPDYAVKILLEKNLIQIVGRKEVIGKPLMFGTTQDFLKHFNLKSISDLPAINELKSDEFEIDEDEDLNDE